MEQWAVLRSGVVIPMRDGLRTCGELWISAGSSPRPTVLVRTPYGRRTHFHQSPIDPQLALERGYNLLIQDVRGRGDSEGDFIPFAQERHDGSDTIDWVVNQNWSDGTVVMSGPSYVGAAQWLAAADRHPALRAIAPANSSPSFGEGWSYREGVREREFLVSWISTALSPFARRRPDDIAHLLAAPAEVFDELVQGSTRWFIAEANDPYWSTLEVDVQRIDIPVFTISGWYDIFARSALRAHALRGRNFDRLLVGPWGHDNYFTHLSGSANLGFQGSAEAIDLGAMVLDFFDTVLGRAPRTAEQSPVALFELGSKRWRALTEWRSARQTDAEFVEIELHGSGEFAVDLDHLPVLTGGHGLAVGQPHSGWGPQDCGSLEHRADVAAFEVRINEQLRMCGDLELLLETAIVDNESHWVALLCERTAGGLQLVTEGILQGAGGSIDIQLGPWSQVFESGTTLVVLVCGGSTPRWDRPRNGEGKRHIARAALRYQTNDELY